MVRLFRLLLVPLLVAVLVGCGHFQPNGESEADEAGPSAESTVIARYADTTVSLAAFEEAYVEAGSTHAQAANDSLPAYRDFLEQYVNYRLKLRAARDAGLDTLSSVQQEVHSYRKELARPRLMERKVYEPLLRTIYERRKQEVDVSHILIRVPPNASPEDTLSAYHTAQSLRDSLDQGRSFGELAYRHSDDPSAQQEGRRGYRGHIGYLRAGQIVEPFEDRMYELDPGEVSDIFRTQYGYHLIKVHDRRPTEQPVQLSHIFLRPNDDSAAVRERLDSLRREIVNGRAAFSEVARAHSEDQQSASRGGDLGEISSLQSLPESLRQAVASLDSVGAVSDVVESSYGFHLLKLTGRKAPQSFEDAYEDLKEQISGQARVERQKTAFARDVRSREGVTVDTAQILDAARASSVDSLARPLLTLTDPSSPSSTPVISLGDSTYTLSQLAQHLMQVDGGARLSVGDLIEDFLNDKAFEYAMVQLEDRDPDFAASMQQYRNGTLLFRFMQDSVWTAASRDTAGLRATYEENRDQYRFPERVRAVTFRAPVDSLLRPYRKRYDETASLEDLATRVDSDSLVSIDTTYVTEQSASVYTEVLSVPDGAIVGPLDLDTESLLLIRDRRVPARSKSFEEALSSVREDYQEAYEEEVLRRLRERYDVETFPNRLRRAFEGPPDESPTP